LVVVLVEPWLPLELAIEAAVLFEPGQDAAEAVLGQGGSKVGAEQAAVGPGQELRPVQSLVVE
jgi:hypothetical protein